MTKTHLFIGFGALASQCADKLVARGDRVIGICRGTRVGSAAEIWRGDARDEPMLERIAAEKVDSLSFILSPDNYDEAGYRSSYWSVVNTVLNRLEKENPEVWPKRVVFISSSSVYGQADGEWVDEKSPTLPTKSTAKILVQTEERVWRSPLTTSVMRFSGIYGPSRDFLIRQVLAGKPGGENMTNRIHEADCVGALLHVLALPSEKLQPCYLASDECPVTAKTIREWLAEQLDVRLTGHANESSRAGNKRCDSTRLRDSGYVFHYPSYREGYKAVLADIKK